jgi:hypothetical protein
VYRWQRGDAVSSAVVTFANREATVVGNVRLAKKPNFANSMGRSCWQSRRALRGESPSLPTVWAKAVGKAGALVGKAQLWPVLLAKLGIFSPFLLLFSSL